MPDIKLITLVKNEIKNGQSESDIYDKLTRDGHDRHRVVEAIDYVNKSTKKGSKPSISLTQTQMILIMVAVIVLIGAGYFLIFYDNSDPSSTVDENMTENPSEIPKRGLDKFEIFESKFTLCEPSVYTSTVIDGSIYHYTIIGPKDGYCEVESKFIQNPNSDLVDADMRCLYDNGMKFEQAINDNSRCSGRLYNLIISGEVEQTETCEAVCNNCRLGKKILIEDPKDNTRTICIDCRYDDDCIDDYECFTDNTCINRQIINSRPECLNMSCIAYPCETCRTGYRTCQSSTIEYKNNKCIECGISNHCKDGYFCEEYRCVEEI